MYQSPIEIIMGDIQSKIIEHQEKMTMEMVRDIGIKVDKDELVKALQYDREQYSKGYSDAIKETKGEWLRMSDLPEKDDDRYQCSRCGNVVHYKSKMDLYTFNSWCGRCGSNNGR